MTIRYGEGIHRITFCNERKRDIGRSLTQAQDNFVELAINLVTSNRELIFDLKRSEEWYAIYNRYLKIKIKTGVQLVLYNITTFL